MGTLSGGGKEIIRVGKRCLIGANAGIGISLGDDCVVEAGLYVTAGTRVTLPDGAVAKAGELSGSRRPAVPPQQHQRGRRGAAADGRHRRAQRRAAQQRLSPRSEASQGAGAPSARIGRCPRRPGGCGGGGAPVRRGRWRRGRRRDGWGAPQAAPRRASTCPRARSPASPAAEARLGHPAVIPGAPGPGGGAWRPLPTTARPTDPAAGPRAMAGAGGIAGAGGCWLRMTPTTTATAMPPITAARPSAPGRRRPTTTMPAAHARPDGDAVVEPARRPAWTRRRCTCPPRRRRTCRGRRPRGRRRV